MQLKMTLIGLPRVGTSYWLISTPITKMASLLSADPFPARTLPIYGPRAPRLTCKICLQRNIQIRHRHHSTMFARQTLIKADQPYMECVTCKVCHNTDIKGDRYKILVTSSTLHDAWLEPTVRNLFHVDLISICGGTMRAGRLDLMSAYGTQPKALDVAVAMGLNDVRRMEPPTFKENLAAFIGNIEGHETFYNVRNTIGFIKMPHVPCMAWLPGDGPLPHKDYRNFLLKVDTFNKIIAEANNKHGKCDNVVSFENEGERRTRKRESQHEWRAFREKKREDMMHLSDYHRAKMYNRVIKYFENNTVQCPEDYNV